MADRSASRSSAFQLLHRAGQRAVSVFAREVGKTALTRSQLAVLLAVRRSSGGSQSAIVEATGIDRSSTAALVLRLVEKGWLQRRRTQSDKRVYAVRLTATGASVLASAEPAVTKTDGALLAPLSASERSRFLEALERIVHNE